MQSFPVFTLSEVRAHNTSKSCYVTLDDKVYDVTGFVDDHPGGADLILEHAGQDIADIMRDSKSHAHSELAYEILEEFFVGFVASATTDDVEKADHRPNGKIAHYERQPLYPATGMSSADDLTRDTDVTADYNRYHFLNLDRPLLMQVWNGGFTKEFYLSQIHRPRHYKGGASAPFFGNFLEPLSKTAWWVVPIVWIPPVAAVSYNAFCHLPIRVATSSWLFGLALWTLVEYLMHRFLFHMERYLPDNRVGITMHFMFHGVHHYLPMDKYRLVMPPALFTLFATPWYNFAHLVIYSNWYAANAVFCGAVFGYICYDLTHYFLHFARLPPFYQELKKWHLEHHFADYNNGFGVTSKFWDRVFGTMIDETPRESAPLMNGKTQ